MNQIADPLSSGRNPDLYRPNVGLAVFSRKGHVLMGRRAGVRRDDARFAWQLPQGGIDKGETPEQAALRELGEETGLLPAHVDLLEELEPWLFYDFPQELKERLPGPFYGQRQKWFAMRFRDPTRTCVSTCTLRSSMRGSGRRWPKRQTSSYRSSSRSIAKSRYDFRSGPSRSDRGLGSTQSAARSASR